MTRIVSTAMITDGDEISRPGSRLTILTYRAQVRDFQQPCANSVKFKWSTERQS